MVMSNYGKVNCRLTVQTLMVMLIAGLLAMITLTPGVISTVMPMSMVLLLIMFVLVMQLLLILLLVPLSIVTVVVLINAQWLIYCTTNNNIYLTFFVSIAYAYHYYANTSPCSITYHYSYEQ